MSSKDVVMSIEATLSHTYDANEVFRITLQKKLACAQACGEYHWGQLRVSNTENSHGLWAGPTLSRRMLVPVTGRTHAPRAFALHMAYDVAAPAPYSFARGATPAAAVVVVVVVVV